MSSDNPRYGRLQASGLIDRTRPLRFKFDDCEYLGFEGDTLASALLANGVLCVARSFKYRRPRGVMSAGFEEPNALVEIGAGSRVEPVARATDVALFEGLYARTVNKGGRVTARLLDPLHRFLPAGFYYKTFKFPRWEYYSAPIRKLAGIGRLPKGHDPDWYVKRHDSCDTLVIGGGVAGIAAARAAAERGDRVFLVEHAMRWGGDSLWRGASVNGADAREWVEHEIAALASRENVRLLPRTTALGYYDANYVTAIERLTDHLPEGERCGPRSRLWKIRAGRTILAAGAIERSLIFPGNDRPGIMLASAAASYAKLYGVRLGERAVVATDHDGGYEAARALSESEIRITVVDSRSSIDETLSVRMRKAGIDVRLASHIVDTHGCPVSAVTVEGPGGRVERVPCDLVAMAGGWTPTVHLFSQSGGTLAFDGARQAFLPDCAPQAIDCVGSAAGLETIEDCIASGAKGSVTQPLTAPALPAPRADTPRCSERQQGRQWIDFFNDVTLADVALATREKMISVEHFKRYTTCGMALDQGKTSNFNALVALGQATDRTPGEVGTTKFRPPFVPVSFGSLAGQLIGPRFHPVRRLPLHDWHLEAGAHMVEEDGWLQPEHFGGSDHSAIQREARHARIGLGIADISATGKMDVVGRDAGAFLDRIYDGAPSNWAVGTCRAAYATGDHGRVIDSGTIARLGQHRYILLTAPGTAATVGRLYESYLQCDWPELDLLLTPVTTQWALFELVGLHAGAVLARLDLGLSPAEEVSAAVAQELDGLAVRLFSRGAGRYSRHGLMVPAASATAVWSRLLKAGKLEGLEPVGLGALDILRVEEGRIDPNADLDGTVMLHDLGAPSEWADRLVGAPSLRFAGGAGDARHELVGLALDGSVPAPAGAEIACHAKGPAEGHVTSSVFSPALSRPIALGYLRRGRDRIGETVTIRDGGTIFLAKVTLPNMLRTLDA